MFLTSDILCEYRIELIAMEAHSVVFSSEILDL